jgi:hypothetical protein
MDTENALNLTDRALVAVADSAAFYDRSIEDVTASLQSFLKGNYANDAALDLSATETTRKAAANQLYGKSFKDLAEDQKQLTLLKMVEDANKLSGAIGQAARESDTWTNQLGNMRQTLIELKATAGGSILEPAIQSLKLMTAFLKHAIDAIKSATREGTFLNQMFKNVTSGLRTAQSNLDRIVKRLGGAENAFKLLATAAASILLAMNGAKIIIGLKAIGAAISSVGLKLLPISALIALIILAVDDFINFMKGNDSVFGELFKQFGINAEDVRGFVNNLIDTAKSLIPVITELAKTVGGNLLKSFKSIIPKIVEFAKRVIPPIIRAVQTLIPIIGDFAKGIGRELYNAFASILPILLDVGKVLLVSFVALLPVIIDLISQLLPPMLQIVQTVLPFLSSMLQQIVPILVNIIQSILPIVIELIQTLLPAIAQIASTILPLIFDVISAIMPLIIQIIDAVLPLIIGLLNQILPIIQPILEIVGSLAQMLLPLIVTMLEAMAPILGNLLNYLQPIFNFLGAIVDVIAKVVGWVADGLNWVVDLIFGEGEAPDTSDASTAVAEAGYASGTESAKEDTALVGEEGPEIVTGLKGKKIFNAAQMKQGLENLRNEEAEKRQPTERPEKPKKLQNIITEVSNIFNVEQAKQGLENLRITIEENGIADAIRGFASSAYVQPQTAQYVTESIDNRNINQSIYFENTFNGDKAGQRQSSNAMNSAAKDITAELARGLAYAR